MNHPVLVTGPGRSGTSAVARILHEELGVNMGRGWTSPPANPRGTYEDAELHRLVVAYNARGMTVAAFLGQLGRIGEERRRRGRPWGFKDPRLCHCLPEWLEVFPETFVLWVTRDRERVVSSWLRHYRGRREDVEAEVNLRLSRGLSVLSELPPGRRGILDLSSRWTDEQIAERVRDLLGPSWASGMGNARPRDLRS